MDITGRKEAESALQTTLHRFYTILSNMYSGVLLVTDAGKIEFANQAFCDRFGLQEDHSELVGLDAGDMIDKIKNAYRQPDDAMARIREILDRGKPVTGEELAMQGGRTYLRDFVPLHVDAKSYGRLWLHTDITERKQIEQQIHELNQQLEDRVRRRTAELESANKELEAFSYSVSHDLRAPLRAIDGFSQAVMEDYGSKLPPEGQEYLETICRGAKRMGELIDDLLAFSRLSRQSISLSPVDTASPLPTIISTLAEKHFLDANPAFLKMSGYESSEVIGHSADELGLWVEPHAREAMLKALEHSPALEPVQTRFRTKSGEIRDVVVVADSIELDGVPCLLGIAHDLTETKRLEAKYLQAQKMEAVGRLAGGIAHDFNNLLMIMGCSADLLQENRLDGLKVDKFSQQIRDAVDKAARLTRQLLAFSRQQVLQPSVLDLNGIIRDLIKMMSRLLGEDIEVELNLEPGLGRVEVDRGQIEQVIMNLAVNARDAMPDGGKLTVTTANVDMDSDHPDLQQMGLTPGSFVVLSIIDTGIGMSAETQSHMLEPFFTTKELGKGTGLGLSTVFGIVKQSNGAIGVHSEPGKGTAFYIYLPRIPKPFAATSDVGGAEPLDGKETILLAEDDDALRHLFANYLRSKGYRVIEAVDGPNALQASEEEKGLIHALVTDMVMPGFGGHKLAELLLARRPDIPVIFLSGYTDRTVKSSSSRHLSCRNHSAWMLLPEQSEPPSRISGVDRSSFDAAAAHVWLEGSELASAGVNVILQRPPGASRLPPRAVLRRESC